MPTVCSANAMYSTILIAEDSGTDLSTPRGANVKRERERNVTVNESSLPAGPAPRLQNPQPMSELRNRPRKLTPNSQPSPEQDKQLYF